MTFVVCLQLQGYSVIAVFAIFCGLVLICTTFISHTVGAMVILPIVQSVGAAMMPTPHARLLVRAPSPPYIPFSIFPSSQDCLCLYAAAMPAGAPPSAVLALPPCPSSIVPFLRSAGSAMVPVPHICMLVGLHPQFLLPLPLFSSFPSSTGGPCVLGKSSSTLCWRFCFCPDCSAAHLPLSHCSPSRKPGCQVTQGCAWASA